MTTSQAPPLAFIYDRHATLTTGTLQVRLEGCHEYAAELGYEVAGEWIDRGDDALTDHRRPRLDELLAGLATAADAGRTVLCLVNGLDRISRDPGRCGHVRYRVRMAGGWTETTTGEHDRPDARPGALTEFPLTATPRAAS